MNEHLEIGVKISPKLLRLFLVISLLPFVVACQSLPLQPHLSPTFSLTQPQHDFSLLNRLAPNNPLQSNPNTPLSGYYPIATSANAFASRSLLIHQAQHSIDVQYYIWHDDETGRLMLQDLYNSANRGVKVRLLLDDMNTTPAIDQQMLAFAKHPNVEVRIANPKKYRQFSALNYIGDLPAINRRMHNKSMTFDGQISIIGGRNIGNEYLRNDKTSQFADLDVLLAGKVVGDVKNSFNAYWNSPISYDIETLVQDTQAPHKPITFTTTNSLLSLPQDITSDPDLALVDSHLLTNQIPFRWVNIKFFADPVEKLSKKSPKADFLVNQLRQDLGKPKREFTIVSSYFVPTDLGIKQLASLTKNGVKVKILTNSYASTDVGAVHSGYAESRRKLLKAGVELYELKTSADPLYRPKSGFSQSLTNPTVQAKLQQGLQKKGAKKTANATPSPALSRASLAQNLPKNLTKKISLSLHTKAFAVDDSKVFIGSYNIDPRSANINTELGVVIDDPLLARQFHDTVGVDLRSQAYQVVLSPNHQLQWITLESANKNASNSPENLTLKMYQNEPHMSIVNLLWVRVFGWMPFNWLL